METLKDFFSDLKDRISNPFVSSFVISWIIFNYQIVIALVFYEQAELKVDGYSSYLDLIASCYNANTMIKYPLYVAGIYTFIVPFFTVIVKIFQAWILTSTDELIFHFTKNKNAVSVELHKKLKTELDETIMQYLTLIKSAGVTQEKNKSLEIEMKNLRETHLESINQLNSENDERMDEQLASAEERYQKLFDRVLIDERNHTDRVMSLETKIEELSRDNDLKAKAIHDRNLAMQAGEKRIETLNDELGKCNAASNLLRDAKARFEKELKTEKQRNLQQLNTLRNWRNKVKQKSHALESLARDAGGALNSEFIDGIAEYFKVVNGEFPIDLNATNT